MLVLSRNRKLYSTQRLMEAIEAGAKDFIVKPFKADDVLAVVNKVLGGGG